ncbi:phage late control D family protein [Xanthobacter flavus]|uniref:phage late control D family protein n=1 Tax=Xanthobacter flavus TaxID=281 RepID=UPI00372CB8D6
MWRRPVLRAVRQGGTLDIFAGPIGQRLVSVKVTDQKGRESDSATIVCADPGRRLPRPKKGEKYSIFMGWADEGLVLQGVFQVEKSSHRGDPGGGELLTIELRAADFIDKLKAKGRKHWDEDTTAGKLFQDIARQAGLSAVISPELANVKIGYRVQWDQSRIDFATEVAGEIGAIVKPAGGKLVVMKSGQGQSGSGKALSPIIMRKRSGFGWEIEIDPRPEYGHVAAAWHDPKKGRRKLVKHATGREGPFHVLPHPFRSEEDAKRAAESEAYDLGNNSGSGHFESPGLPFARAEAPVIASGYGDGIDGRWVAETVEHECSKSRGFVTTVTVGSGKDKKD